MAPWTSTIGRIPSLVLICSLINVRLTDLDVGQLLVLPHAGHNFCCFRHTHHLHKDQLPVTLSGVGDCLFTLPIKC